MIPNVNMPAFIKRELSKLEEIIAPPLKKATKYGLFSFPLILISIFNLVSLLFFMPEQENMLVPVLLYALIGAIGLALSKEAKTRRKEIQQMSADYVISRIEKSDIASAGLKKKYISMIKEKPVMAINHFVQFLEAENRENNYWS